MQFGSEQKKQQTKLEFIYKNIEQMLMEWSSLMEKQWRKFRDDFSNYLKYYIFECEAMLEMTKNTKIAEDQYLKKENELAMEKHKLFGIKDLDKWKLAPEDRKMFSQAALMHNKKLSFPKMLPNVYFFINEQQETKEVEKRFARYGYFLNRTKEEVDRVLDTRINTMFTHFNSIAEDYATFSEEVEILREVQQMAKMWRDFKGNEEIPVEEENVGKEQKEEVIRKPKKKLDVHLHVKISKDGKKKVNIVEDDKENCIRGVKIEEVPKQVEEIKKSSVEVDKGGIKQNELERNQKVLVDLMEDEAGYVLQSCEEKKEVTEQKEDTAEPRQKIEENTEPPEKQKENTSESQQKIEENTKPPASFLAKEPASSDDEEFNIVPNDKDKPKEEVVVPPKVEEVASEVKLESETETQLKVEEKSEKKGNEKEDPVENKFPQFAQQQ
eukprot:TRINITY_DN839_c0_g1_i4.p1 TRINITY_DN839_c0_g1~~TRINITY_DN839_c0_g1_i4.p1  ORF type:complete len:440 (+),score=105.81 TRINITY_DN839_c0_g1_i4:1201-2520(+)